MTQARIQKIFQRGGGPTLRKEKNHYTHTHTHTGDQHFEVNIAGLSDETLIPRPCVTARVGTVKIPHCSMAPSAEYRSKYLKPFTDIL